MLSVHLVLELFSVVVAALVVVMAWHAFKVEDLRVANTLILTFTLVMAMDFFHALSYAGMPDLGSPSSTSKAIFFWFAGRGIELLGLWLVVLRVSLPGSRMQWQWLGLAGVGLLFFLGTWRLDWFPETFVEGEGVTDFKTAVEWLLCLGYLAAVPMFWREAARDAALSRKYYYAAACFAMGVGDLTFTSYVSAASRLALAAPRRRGSACNLRWILLAASERFWTKSAQLRNNSAWGLRRSTRLLRTWTRSHSRMPPWWSNLPRPPSLCIAK